MYSPLFPQPRPSPTHQAELLCFCYSATTASAGPYSSDVTGPYNSNAASDAASRMNGADGGGGATSLTDRQERRKNSLPPGRGGADRDAAAAGLELWQGGAGGGGGGGRKHARQQLSIIANGKGK